MAPPRNYSAITIWPLRYELLTMKHAIKKKNQQLWNCLDPNFGMWQSLWRYSALIFVFVYQSFLTELHWINWINRLKSPFKVQRCVIATSLTHRSLRIVTLLYIQWKCVHTSFCLFMLSQSGQHRQTKMTFYVSCKRKFLSLIVRRLLLGIINVTRTIRLHYKGRYILCLCFIAKPWESQN